jgi:hypothetical protein
VHKTLAVAVVLLSLTFAGCDEQTAAANSGPPTEADRPAILSTLNLTADTSGKVMNECGDLVTPQFLPAELGGAVGTAVLFAIGGGPTMASCYGDGPDIHLLKREAGSWREIYSARGRSLIILPTSTDSVRDIADGGPGFSFPVFTWNGVAYARADREVSDGDLEGMQATYLP